MSTHDLVIDAAATYRLVRLVTEDTFPPVQALRNRIVEAHTTYDDQGVGDPDNWAELVECPWCASWWIALGVVAARRLAPRFWDPVARGLSFSLVSGLIASKIDI